MPRYFCVLVILFALALPAAAAAQRLPETLESFRPGDRIRIRTLTHGLHIGTMVLVGVDSVHLHPERGSNQVEIRAIECIWSRGNAAGTGATVGGISVGALSAAFAAFATSAIAGSVDAEITVKFGIVGALAGGIVGAGLGSLIGEWHSEYP